MLSLLANQGGCNATCQLRARHAVSLHANGKVRQGDVATSSARIASFLHAAAHAAHRLAAVELS